MNATYFVLRMPLTCCACKIDHFVHVQPVFTDNVYITCLTCYRIGLHTARIHQEAGRSLRKRMADTLREALPEQVGAPPGEQCQA